MGRRAAAQIEIEIFDLGAPAPGERNFDASAQRPAIPRLAAIVGGGEGTGRGGRIRVDLTPRAAARRDVMMPGVWAVRSSSSILSIHYSRSRRWSSPIGCMAALVI